MIWKISDLGKNVPDNVEDIINVVLQKCIVCPDSIAVPFFSDTESFSCVMVPTGPKKKKEKMKFGKNTVTSLS